jgi:predicted DNA-binding ribbon-helix-helix protein
VTRVVTHAGRRTSVRLEPVFWRALARLAARQGLRVGPFIGQVADSATSGNLTARLRALCMLAAERDRAARSAAGDRSALWRVVEAAPTPALLLGPETEILDANPAFDGWLAGARVRDLPLADVFRIRSALPFREVWRELHARRRAVTGIGLLRIAEGRVTAAEGTIVPLGAAGDADRTAAIAWISVRGAKAQRSGAAAPARQPSTTTSAESDG